MADQPKEEIETGITAARFVMSRLLYLVDSYTPGKPKGDEFVVLRNGLKDSIGAMERAWERFCKTREGSARLEELAGKVPDSWNLGVSMGAGVPEQKCGICEGKEPDFGPEDVSVFPPIPGSDKPHWLGLVADEDEYDAWLSKLTPEQLKTHQEHMAAVMERAKSRHSGPTKQAKVIGICLKCNGAVCDGEQDETEFPISHKGCGGEVAVHLDMPDGKPAIRLRSESSKKIKGRGLVKYIKQDGWIEHNYSKLPGWEVLIDEVLYRVLNVETAKGMGGKLLGSVGLVVRPVRKAMEE